MTRDERAPDASLDASTYREQAHALLHSLFPICRSLTGDGIRETYRLLGEHVPLELIEIPSGTRVLDWIVPDEWNIRDAYVAGEDGTRVIDFHRSNLHVVGYSEPVRARMTLEELRPRLHTLPEQPDAIPYRTSYYERTWGFCLEHERYEALQSGDYEVCIDSTLVPGTLTLAEAVLPGESEREVLLSTYCCHPSLANNELSGPVLLSLLYRYLASLPQRRFTYRFYFGPETIGAIAYLSLRGDQLRESLHAGLVATCCGDRGAFTYKQVRNRSNPLDRAVTHALAHSEVAHSVLPFFPTGSDERQYCSPGFDLPVGSLMRSMYGTYPEYHTSLDDLDLVSPDALVETLRLYVRALYALEHARRYRNLKPRGEPQLGRYGLYASLGGSSVPSRTRLLRYVLNFADGEHDLLDIAHRADAPIWDCVRAVDDLTAAGLLERLD